MNRSRTRKFVLASLSLASVLLCSALTTPAAAQGQSNCLHVSGNFSGPFMFTSPTTGAAVGTVTGDYTGAFAATYFDFNPRGSLGQGALALRGTHTVTTALGTFTTGDEILLLPTGDPSVRATNARLTIVEGTGIFEGATGVLHTHGEATFTSQFTANLDIDFQGRICLQE